MIPWGSMSGKDLRPEKHAGAAKTIELLEAVTCVTKQYIATYRDWQGYFIAT